jgi:REP element-mobilizing transposase RayT
MPAQIRSRLRLQGEIHHVALRGHGGRPLFRANGDRQALEDIVGELLAEFTARAHAYCWMTNHLHLVLEVAPAQADSFQCDLIARYSLHVNAGASAAGPLFDPAERAFRVNADAYLLQLIRYVHLNPVRAGLVRDAADYPWSGHRTYLGCGGPPWLSTDLAFRLLGGDLLRAAAAYRVFVAPVSTRVNREALVSSLSYPGRY